VEGGALPGQPRPVLAEDGQHGPAVGRGARRQHQEGLQRLAVQAPQPVAEPGRGRRRRGEQAQQRRQLRSKAAAVGRTATPALLSPWS